MSARKNILAPFPIIEDGDMSLASLTSEITNIQYLDNIVIELDFTGTPTGTFEVQGSLSFERDIYGNVTNPGNWTALNLVSSPVASGVAGTILIDMNQLSFPYIRVVYTRTGGTGVLNALIGGKQL